MFEYKFSNSRGTYCVCKRYYRCWLHDARGTVFFFTRRTTGWWCDRNGAFQRDCIFTAINRDFNGIINVLLFSIFRVFFFMCSFRDDFNASWISRHFYNAHGEQTVPKRIDRLIREICTNTPCASFFAHNDSSASVERGRNMFYLM